MLNGLFVAFRTKRALHPHSSHSNFGGSVPMCPHKSPLIVLTLRTFGLLHLGQIWMSTSFPSFSKSSKNLIRSRALGFPFPLPRVPWVAFASSFFPFSFQLSPFGGTSEFSINNTMDTVKIGLLVRYFTSVQSLARANRLRKTGLVDAVREEWKWSISWTRKMQWQWRAGFVWHEFGVKGMLSDFAS